MDLERIHLCCRWWFTSMFFQELCFIQQWKAKLKKIFYFFQCRKNISSFLGWVPTTESKAGYDTEWMDLPKRERLYFTKGVGKIKKSALRTSECGHSNASWTLFLIKKWNEDVLALHHPVFFTWRCPTIFDRSMTQKKKVIWNQKCYS